MEESEFRVFQQAANRLTKEWNKKTHTQDEQLFFNAQSSMEKLERTRQHVHEAVDNVMAKRQRFRYQKEDKALDSALHENRAKLDDSSLEPNDDTTTIESEYKNRSSESEAMLSGRKHPRPDEDLPLQSSQSFSKQSRRVSFGQTVVKGDSLGVLSKISKNLDGSEEDRRSSFGSSLLSTDPDDANYVSRQDQQEPTAKLYTWDYLVGSGRVDSRVDNLWIIDGEEVGRDLMEFRDRVVLENGGLTDSHEKLAVNFIFLIEKAYRWVDILAQESQEAIWELLKTSPPTDPNLKSILDSIKNSGQLWNGQSSNENTYLKSLLGPFLATTQPQNETRDEDSSLLIIDFSATTSAQKSELSLQLLEGKIASNKAFQIWDDRTKLGQEMKLALDSINRQQTSSSSDPTDNLKHFMTLNQDVEWIAEGIDVVQRKSLPSSIGRVASRLDPINGLNEQWPTLTGLLERVFAKNHYDMVNNAIANEDMVDPVARYIMSIIHSYSHYFSFHNTTRYLEVLVTGVQERKNWARDELTETKQTGQFADGVTIWGGSQLYISETSSVLNAKTEKLRQDEFKLARAMKDSWVSQVKSTSKHSVPRRGVAVFGSSTFNDETKFWRLDFRGVFRLVHFDTITYQGMDAREEVVRPVDHEVRELLLESVLSIQPTTTTPTKTPKKRTLSAPE
ncbi:hypothetical protein FBU30_004654 [Linnemannia zychae]|nr:hypothetical protein FBU30_004654 [Linnemannia zychae]